jgi:2-dehydropantoate 2-reductase
VFGAGGVGGVISGQLAAAGREVHLIDPWYHHIEAIRADGLKVQTLDDEFTAHPITYHLDELDGLGQFDAIIVAMKSYDTRWVARVLADHLKPNGIACSAQNGMNEAALQDAFGAERVVGCVVPMTVELVSEGVVRRGTEDEWGTLTIGALQPQQEQSVDQLVHFLSAMVGVNKISEIVPDIWAKLILNTMSNCLGGITGFTVRPLWTTREVVDVALALAHETATLALASGVTPNPVLRRISPQALADMNNRDNPTWSEAAALMHDAADGRTGKRDNAPSLLQDVRKGRRTEVDYLNGFVVNASEDLGLSAPMHQLAVDQVHAVELRRVEVGPTALKPLGELCNELYG